MKTTHNRKTEILMLDLGNVLIDLEIERFHENVEKRINRNISLGNDSLHHRYMAGQFDEETMRQKIAEQYGLHLSASEFPLFWSGMLGRDRTELLPYLRELKKCCKLALCSNTDATHIQFLKNRKSPMILGFDFYCYSYELGYVKPDKSYFRAVLEIMKIESEKCLFLDDGEKNVAAAMEVGIKAIHTPDINSVIHVLESLIHPGLD